MKRIFKSIFCCLLFLGFTCSCATKEIEKTDAILFKEEYEALNGTIREKDGRTIRSLNIPTENPMIYQTEDQIVERIENKESFVVYFGFTDCPWCRSVLPSLIQVASDYNLKTIYYVNVGEIRDTLTLGKNNKIEIANEGTEGYKKLIDLLSNVLDDYTLTDEEGNIISANEKRIYAPNIISVKEGIGVNMVEGISDNQTDGYAEITEEMQQDMYKIFGCLIKSFVENTDEKC